MGFKSMMNNYFYGKQGQADFTVADLPANRFQLFGAVLKVRWSGLVGVNLLYMAIWIPAIVWTVMNVVLMNGMLMDENTSYANADYLNVISMWLLVMFPCIGITGPFNAGVTYVLRNWARDQHSFVLSDFWDAVKGNWKQALPVSLISGAIPFLLFIGIQYYTEMARTTAVFLLPVAVMVVAAAVWTMMTMVIYPMMVTYELKLGDIIRNALLLTIGKLPFAVLFKALTLALPLLAFGLAQLLPGASQYIMLVLVVLYCFFMPAFNKLITVSYANWLCETFMNSRIEGAATNIGLRPENWDDTEYRPEDDE